MSERHKKPCISSCLSSEDESIALANQVELWQLNFGFAGSTREAPQGVSAGGQASPLQGLYLGLGLYPLFHA